MVYIILGTGFEEAEALIPCDLLRRAGVETAFVGIGSRDITGGHGITLRADCTVEETELTAAQMLVLPGGLSGVQSILGSEKVLTSLKNMYAAGGYVAAICAAPTVLASLGITDGREATCYPSMENEMGAAHCVDRAAVADGKVITGRAAGSAFDFGLLLVKTLCGEEAAQRVAGSIYY